MDKLNFINEYTTHHVITSLYEVNQFLKFFSKPDTILLKKISHEFWQSDKAFDHFFIDKKNDLVHVYTVKKDHLKFIHLKRDLKELTCLSELEKNYQALQIFMLMMHLVVVIEIIHQLLELIVQKNIMVY